MLLPQQRFSTEEELDEINVKNRSWHFTIALQLARHPTKIGKGLQSLFDG
jgi:hypothetical protein